jgi:uncharacterized protein (TIGR02145 family)
MKKEKITLVILILLSINIIAQGPAGFNYQAVIRDNSGDLITNQNVSIRISIRDVTANGTILYRETHTALSNDFGLVNLIIGAGTPVSGNFEDINWGLNDKFLSIDIDPNGGSSFIAMGTSQLLNVPFSIHAEESSGLVNMSSSQRDAVGSPYMGMQLFNTDTRKINYYDGYGWVEINGVKQANFICGNPLLDSRNGKYYNTVELGGTCWMAQNLNYGNMIDALEDQSDNGVPEKYCYSNNPGLCETYGALYQWREMMQYTTTEGTRGICPEGWHLPSSTEWTNLINATGGPNNAGANLVQGGPTGFEALMAGQRNLYAYPFLDIGSRAWFWTSTQASSSYANNLYIINNDPHVYTGQQDKNFGHSVRCVKD